MTPFLYLVRHGEASPHDGPLSLTGQEQARLTGRRLRDVPFSAVYHGPLPRAAQTAELIAASLPGVPVSACDLAGDYIPSNPDRMACPPRWSPSTMLPTSRRNSAGPASLPPCAPPPPDPG
jgi:probable phosphoglycerate mutase